MPDSVLHSRRQFLQTSSLSAAGLLAAAELGNLFAADQPPPPAVEPFPIHNWQRDARNPILPSGGIPEDVGCCMNPFAIRNGDEYWLYYAGADKQRRRRICLATAPVDDLSNWKRHGPLFDLGTKGSFDEFWCVLPCVHRIGDKWHLYYTGRRSTGGGLQSFQGIGLAVSDNLRDWKKVSDTPVLAGDGFSEWPDNRGIAGGGRILDLPQPDGSTRYRMHYTLATGTPSKDKFVDQAKYSVIAHSTDGRTWTDKQVVLRPRLDSDYENIATIALNVWKTNSGWRAIYAGIGTRFGAYSICEAASSDGLHWNRGRPGTNLSLPPTGKGWERQMTCYPNVIEENGKLRLFYCGNGYGATGIGTALAEKRG